MTTQSSKSQRAAQRPDRAAVGRRVVAEEADALQALARSIGESFDRAVETILNADGMLIVTGLGKSGIVANKIAATLTSTGTPAVFMHPVEALHGDLGIVTRRNVMLALSKSGATEEILRFIDHFKRLGGPTIAVTDNARSRLAELADVVIVLPPVPEAGPLNLAPTTSTTMMTALGDALAMALLDARGFTPDDFAQVHPEGYLGKRLLLRVEDIIPADRGVPLVRQDQSFEDLLREIDAKRLGMACIVDEHGKLIGVFTDGDLRRLLLRGCEPARHSLPELLRLSRRDPHDPPVKRSTVHRRTFAVECRNLMEESKITCLVVVDEHDRPVAVVQQHDVVAAGIA